MGEGIHRLWWRGAPGAFVLLALAAAAHAGHVEVRPDRTVVHLTVCNLPEAGKTDVGTRADQAVVRGFQRRFAELMAPRIGRPGAAGAGYGIPPGRPVEVELHRPTGIEVKGVESTLLAIAGGVAPDVLYVNFRQSDTYIRQGFLHPLDRPEDGYAAAMPADEWRDRVHPLIEPVIRRAGPGGTHVWALPYGGALGRVVLFRKDLFDEAGVPYPGPAWTWDDFLAACRRLADPGRGRYGVAFPRGKHESHWWTAFLWSAGGDVMVSGPGGDGWRIVFDSAEAAVALDFYTRILAEPWTDTAGRPRRGYAHRDGAEIEARWSRGDIAMRFEYMGEQLFAQINPDLTGIAPVPAGPGGLRAGELNSRMMGLHAGITDRIVRDAAWEYMRYFDGDEAARLRTQVFVESGYGRFVNPRLLERYGHTAELRLAPREWAETHRIAVETGRPEPFGPGANSIYDLLTRPIEEAESLAVRDRLPEEGPERMEALRGLLAKAARRAEREMLGRRTPGELVARRATAAGALLAIAAGFGLAARGVARALGGASAPDGRRSRRLSWAWLLLAPALLTILAWQYVPLARGSLMALQDYRLMGGSAWVGLDNFGDVLWDADWWRAVWNSLRYSVLVIALTFLPPVGLAIVLQEIPRGRVLFRTLFYLPAVLSGLVVTLLWKTFYDPTERGWLNALLLRVPACGFLLAGALAAWLCLAFARRLALHRRGGAAAALGLAGVALLSLAVSAAEPMLARTDVAPLRRLLLTWPEPVRWLADTRTSMLACVLPMLWAGIGPGCLIYLAALKGVPDDLYEAAEMDGATFADKVLFVVVPVLRPLLTINFIGVFIGAWLHAGGHILAMTGGAAGTEVAELHIFYKAFVFLQFGPATAMAWVLGSLLIGFTIQQLRMISRLEFRAAGADR